MKKLNKNNSINQQDVHALEFEAVLSLNIEDLINQQLELNPKLARVLDRIKNQKENACAYDKHSNHNKFSNYQQGILWGT